MGVGAWGQELGDGSNIFWMTYFQNIFCMIQKHWFFCICMGVWARGIIICFWVCFQITYFCRGCRVGVWGWRHGDDSVSFFLNIFIEDAFFILWLKWFIWLKLFIYSHWNWSMGKGNDYFFLCLVLDDIFLFGLEHGGGNVGAGAWGWEQYFLDDLFSKHFFVWFKNIDFFILAWKCGPGVLSVFGQHNFNWKGAWGWEHGGRRVAMGAI